MNNQAKKENTYPLFDQQENAISAYMGSLLGVVPENNKEALDLADANLKANNSNQEAINAIKNQIINEVTLNDSQVVSNNNKVIPIQVTDENGDPTVKFIEPRLKEINQDVKQLKKEGQEKLLSHDESVSQTPIKVPNYETNNLSNELIKFETNKIRYRNLKQFLSKDASSDEIEAVSRKKVIVENTQLKKDLINQKQINDGLNIKVEQLSNEVKGLKQLEYNHHQIDKNIPAWAVPSFQAMSLRLKQLKVAIPMHLFQSVLSVEVENLYHHQTKMGNQLLIGEIEFENQRITLLDLKSVIFPTNKGTDIQDREFSIIVIKDEMTETLFGIICDDISGVETYNFQDLAWKTSTTSRKWLAATNRKDKSVVLDTRGLFHVISSIE